jgi:hypothetical protein
MCHQADDKEWWLIVVYGPSNDVDKPAFLDEVWDLVAFRLGLWLLTGDFNLMYHTADKNNGNLNRRLMGQFRWLLNDTCLREIHLNGRLFMWGNERDHPTLERIDRALISKEWDEFYPCHDLTSLASMCSDHAPLHLCIDHGFKYHKWFHFHAYWPKFLGFEEVVHRV